MSPSTHFPILRYLVLGPRAWMLLLIVLGLLWGLTLPLSSSQRPSWVWGDADWHGLFWLRPSRIGRWVGRLCGVLRTSSVPLLGRMGLLQILITGSGLTTLWPECRYWVWLPVLEWGLGLGGWLWPAWLVQPWYRDWQHLVRLGYRWSVLGLGLLTLHQWVNLGPAGMFLGVVCARDGSRVEVARTVDPAGQAAYRVRMAGEFVFQVTPRDEFEKRMLMLDWRRLRTPGHAQSAWGLVTQEALARVFEVTQEEISRWQKYARAGQWAHLLSQQDKSLLTEEVRQRIVEAWAAKIWQTAAEVRPRMVAQGVEVAQRVVEEAGRQSGLMLIRAALKEQWVQGAAGLRPRETYVTERLFEMVEQLQQRLEQGQGAPVEPQVAVAGWRPLAGGAPVENRLEKPWPWLFQVEHWLFGAWELVEDGSVRCPYCGSDHVAVKSKQPRDKVYLDAHGERQKVAVYRYYCKNPDCSYQTFTNLPPGVIAHSVWTLDARLKALEL